MAEQSGHGPTRQLPDLLKTTTAATSSRHFRKRSGAAGDDGRTARAAELREALGDGLDCTPVIVEVAEAKVKADCASVAPEHRARLDAVLKVRAARLPDESAEPRARRGSCRVERPGAG
jgi:hypothetical protein